MWAAWCRQHLRWRLVCPCAPTSPIHAPHPTPLHPPTNPIQRPGYAVFEPTSTCRTNPQVFVANPNKTRAVVEILFNNKEKLLKYLDDFHNDRGEAPEAPACSCRGGRRTRHGLGSEARQCGAALVAMGA